MPLLTNTKMHGAPKSTDDLAERFSTEALFERLGLIPPTGKRPNMLADLRGLVGLSTQPQEVLGRSGAEALKRMGIPRYGSNKAARLGAGLATLVNAAAGGWIPRKPYEPAQKPGWTPPKPYDPAQGMQAAQPWIPRKPYEPAQKPGWTPPKPYDPAQGMQPKPSAVVPPTQPVVPPVQPLVPKAASAAYKFGSKLAVYRKQAALERYYVRVLEKAAAELGVDVPMTKEASIAATLALLAAVYGIGRGGYDIGKGFGWWGKPENAYVKNINEQAEGHRAALATGQPWLSPMYQQGYGNYGRQPQGYGGYGGQQPGGAMPGSRPGQPHGLYNRDEQRYAARLGINPQEYQSQERMLQDMMSGSAIRARLARGAREYGSSPMW